jgi:tetratricopeptide (TPR) repeat protein
MKQLFFYAGIAAFVLACKPNPKPVPQQVNVPSVDNNLQELEQAIAGNPDSVKLYDRLIDTLTSRKQYDAAAKWCNKLIGRGADSNYYYWFVKGDVLRRGQLYDSAIAAYQTYLTKFPDDEQVLLNLANTYAEAGNKNAVDLANKIAARFPNREMRSEATFIKGVYYNQVKQYPEARKWLDTTIVINYTFSEAYMEKGCSFYDEGRYKEALRTFTNLAKINNGYADAWYWMAKCQEALGKPQEAINNYDQAYALDHNITEAKTAVARLQKTLAAPVK